MIGDENSIIDSRRFKSANENVRIFKIPKFHFDANEYFNLVDWDNFSEPPLRMDLSNKELLEIVKKGEIVLCGIAEIRCHSQAVENCQRWTDWSQIEQSIEDAILRHRHEERFCFKMIFLQSYLIFNCF
jgi:hypothetical protein